MFKKALLASGLLLASMAAQAGVISYNGYTRATDSNIVTGGGLEWLKWDVTKGFSINQALAAYGPSGWKLASNTQVKNLFDAFQFGHNDWTADENKQQTVSTPWDSSETGAHEKFINMFGVNLRTIWSIDADPELLSLAIFGSDADNDSRYNYAQVRTDWTSHHNYRSGGSAHISLDTIDVDGFSDMFGVALVRDNAVPPPSQVSLPGTLSTLALGLVAFGVRRRQVLGR